MHVTIAGFVVTIFLPVGIFVLLVSNILWYFFRHVNNHNRNLQSIFKKFYGTLILIIWFVRDLSNCHNHTCWNNSALRLSQSTKNPINETSVDRISPHPENKYNYLFC